jgi:hypothetical protein
MGIDDGAVDAPEGLLVRFLCLRAVLSCYMEASVAAAREN